MTGNENEIHTFCTGRFGITFPQFVKIEVNEKNESPLYTFLKSQKGGILGSKIKWNFTKFLVDQNCNVTARYAPTDSPEKIDKDIAEMLRRS
jgi:glutathione peroxidase